MDIAIQEQPRPGFPRVTDESRYFGSFNARGAGDIAHLNGGLLEHLERTEVLLRRWGCSEVHVVGRSLPCRVRN